jgi:sulfate permease, SulP family
MSIYLATMDCNQYHTKRRMQMAKLTQPGDLPLFDGQRNIVLDVSNHETLTLPKNTHETPPYKNVANSVLSEQRASAPSSKSAEFSDVLDGLVSSIPIGLAGVALAYSSLPTQYLGMGVLATLLTLGLVHIASAATARPIAYSARLFEATTLAAILMAMAKSMPGWGLAASPAQLLALLCIVSAMAGVVCAGLYLLRADRFTRLIPAPVYSGFAISIAALLLISQSQSLYRLWQQGSPWLVLLCICLVSMAVALLVRKFRPRWPSTALSIAAGALVGLAWVAVGSPVVMIMPAGQNWALPWQAADFASLAAGGVNHLALATSIFYNALLLGTMLFINMTVANETISQIDDRVTQRWQQAGVSLVVALGGAIGSAPVASSVQASMAAIRNSPISAGKVVSIGVLCWLVAGTGLLNWVAISAVAAAMLVDAYFMADRQAIKQGWSWLRGAKLQSGQKEDLTLVALVTFTAVIFNVVSAVFVGLLFGLILFAMRNAKTPVRYVWTGAQLHSNCARGRGEIAVLASHGEKIRVVEFEGELFFGSVASLEKHLRQALQGATCVILDWSRVRHVDSSIALPLARWLRLTAAENISTYHAGAGLQAGNVLSFLQQHFGQAQHFPDVDRALESAESAIIARYAASLTHETTQLSDALHILRGLSDSQRSQLEGLMPQRLFKGGSAIFNAGDPSDHLLIVLQGSAGVIVQGVGGRDIRITSVRRGGVLGEIGFLDEAPRSAQVMAQEDVLAAILSREVFDRLREKEPGIVTQLLTNLTLDLSTRLRHTNKLALARGING